MTRMNLTLKKMSGFLDKIFEHLIHQGSLAYLLQHNVM